MGLSCFIGFVWPFDICIPQKQPVTLHVALGIGCTSQYVCSLCLLVYHFLTWLKAGWSSMDRRGAMYCNLHCKAFPFFSCNVFANWKSCCLLSNMGFFSLTICRTCSDTDVGICQFQAAVLKLGAPISGRFFQTLLKSSV
jgi:hypothetical protein